MSGSSDSDRVAECGREDLLSIELPPSDKVRTYIHDVTSHSNTTCAHFDFISVPTYNINIHCSMSVFEKNLQVTSTFLCLSINHPI
jgi:hypothetical protein